MSEHHTTSGSIATAIARVLTENAVTLDEEATTVTIDGVVPAEYMEIGRKDAHFFVMTIGTRTFSVIVIDEDVMPELEGTYHG